MRTAILGVAAVSLLPLASFGATLEERVEALEKSHAELYHTPAEKKEGEPGIKLGDRVSISGLLEAAGLVETVEMDGDDSERSTDLVLQTAQLGFRAKLNEYLTANFVLLLEEEEGTVGSGSDATIDFDEATIDYARGAWSARFGRQSVPFGDFFSHFIDDPILLDLGETRETAVSVSCDFGGLLSVSAFGFAGDADRVGDSQDLKPRFSDWGLSVRTAPVEQLEAGASFLSDLAESDADWPDEATHYEKRVPGWSAFARASLGPVELSAEVLGAAKAFEPDDLDADGDGEGDEPLAWNVEAAWDVIETVEVAGRVEGSREFADHPELQFGADVSWGVYEGVTLSASYLHGTFDEDFSGGVEKRDRFVVQLAAEF